MPHIIVKLYPGRSEEVKTNLANNVAKAIEESLNISIGAISVSIEEVEKEDWKSKVYTPDIINNKEILYKAPTYEI